MNKSFLVLLALALTAVSGRAEEIHLPFQSSGAMKTLGGYMPQKLELSTKQPAAVTKLPPGVTAPLFGQLVLGPVESPHTFFVLVDEPEGKPSQLFVDANGNGDFTDDAAPEWKGRPGKDSAGKTLTSYMGGATLKLAYTSTSIEELHLGIYRFDKNDPNRHQLGNALFYYGDYARTGAITLGGKPYQAILADQFTTGDFRGKTNEAAALLIDVNGDGKFSSPFERFPLDKPFNIGGTTYEISGLTASGGSFQLNKSSQTVAETKPMAELSAGHPAVKFQAADTADKTIKFPDSYKGKVVLLDFWATWCGPCVGEMPNVVAAYNKYHAQGFDVLGVSFDRAGDGDKLAAFTKSHSMPWPQIFEGKFWQTTIGGQYYIQSIPHAFLVDGDTGLIVAEGNDIRGDALVPAIEKALAHKSH